MLGNIVVLNTLFVYFKNNNFIKSLQHNIPFNYINLILYKYIQKEREIDRERVLVFIFYFNSELIKDDYQKLQ